MRNYGRVLEAFRGTNWVIRPDKAEAMAAVLEMRVNGMGVVAEDFRAAAIPRVRKTARSVAVLPLFGILANRMNMLIESSGGTSMESFGRIFDGAVNDPNIGAIVLDIDSPGGTVAGTPELSDKIFAARSVKPIYAVANADATSGAYWLGTSAIRMYATPSGMVGSVGVLRVHEDHSKALAEEGVTLTIVRAGRYKAEGNSYEPLSEETRDHWQAQSNEDYDMFIDALARNRGTRKRQVHSDFGEGRVFSAKDAASRGMIDGIKTLDEVIAMIAK